jgi:hypothetical protein
LRSHRAGTGNGGESSGIREVEARKRSGFVAASGNARLAPANSLPEFAKQSPEQPIAFEVFFAERRRTAKGRFPGSILLESDQKAGESRRYEEEHACRRR